MTSEAQSRNHHIPVMRDEVLMAVAPRDGGAYVDGTFGAGGYTRAILDAADTTVWAIDRDPDAIRRGEALREEYSDRLTLLRGRFGDMSRLLHAAGLAAVDGVVLDLGASSPQLDDAERGFSFRFDGPLDMRMGDTGPTAADIVNDLEETELANIIYNLGEERRSRQVASAIVRARDKEPITTTGRLAAIIHGVMPAPRQGQPDSATRSFQALRIYVNRELGEIEDGLAAAEAMLKPGGILAVVSFHSLEDRIVKRFLGARSGARARPSRARVSLAPVRHELLHQAGDGGIGAVLGEVPHRELERERHPRRGARPISPRREESNSSAFQRVRGPRGPSSLLARPR